jgi:DNA-binding NtrC family response regulator/tetratricopeptide (TPR) repeat protein
VAPLAEVLGESPAIRAVRATVERLLAHGVEGRRLPPLLIQGETGTGKGLLARAIHRAGPRSAGPLVEVNCAAIPETLLEAELFGFERGAFTDARQPKAGLFQTAHQGTLFLDEVGLLSEGVQAKLLKVLEDHSVRRLGSTRSEPADVALVAATSEDLRDAIRARRFREDLYHRLAVVTVQLPPLAERGPDILPLAEHFLERACADYGLAGKRLTPDARAALCAYAWPGNVRELANVMERAALITESPVVTAAALGLLTPTGLENTEPARHEKPRRSRGATGTAERAQLLEALTDTQWNIARAAARLQMPRGTLRYRIEKLGLTRNGASTPAPAGPSVARASPEPMPPVRARPRRSAGAWERRQLAFLRASLVPASDRDARVEIGRVPEILVDKVEAFGGRVEALGPLSLVAAFGVEPVEDAPRRAAHAAIAMRKAIERAWLATSHPVGTKIAIHATQGLVGQAGEGSVIDAAATSQAHVVLEALMTAVERDAILVSPAAARALERRFTLVPIGVVEPAGGRGYRLEGLEQPGLAPRGGMTPFVGRDSELEQVHRALARAETSHGQVVALVGEPGVGKSRLVWEIAHAHRAHGWLVLQGAAVSYGTATPYLPVVNLLRTYFQVGDQDEPRAIRAKVTQKLLALDPALESTLPAILALLDAPVEDRGWEMLSPPARRQHTINALKQLLLRESQAQPLLVVVEDLHWIDAETQAALDRLVESLPAARLLLLVNYRPEYRHDWSGKTYYLQLRLDALLPEQARELLETLLGGDVGLAPVKPLLLARTEGNPFFLEEGVRSLVDDGVLLGDRGAYQLVKAPEAIDVPGTVQAILAARIDRLPADDRDLLQIASVVGTDVPVAVLAAVAGRAADALADGLARLQSAELLYETTLVPDTVYTFKHALTHEVAYDSLLPEQRRALHARIVEAIEALYPDRLAEHVERLAHHAFRGEVWEKAVAYLQQAGARAAARSAHRAAVAWYEQALSVLQRMPETRETQEQSVDLRLELRMAHWWAGELGKLLPSLREAERLARTLGDQRRLGWVWSWIGQYLLVTGDSSQALAYAQNAENIGVSFGDVRLTAAARYVLGWACHTAGDFLRAEDLLGKVVQGSQGNMDPLMARLSAAARWSLAVPLGERGAFHDAITQAQEGIQVAEKKGDPYSLISGYWGLGHVCSLKGDLSRAGAMLERALTLARGWNFPIQSAYIAAQLGHVYAWSERATEGLALVRQACADLESAGVVAFHSLAVAHLSEACRLAGRLDYAHAAAARALSLARERGERGREAEALRLLGDVAAHPERLDATAAVGQYSQALAQASELGMRPTMAHCHLGLGRLAGQTGDAEKAQTHLTTAAAMYRDMGMEFWLAQTEMASRSVGLVARRVEDTP